MADWTNIPDVDVEAGGIPKGSTITALRDNVTAAFEGAVGGPKLVNNAVANSTLSAGKFQTSNTERDWVLGRNAGAGAGVVGSYLLAFNTTGGSSTNFGQTVSGSTLNPASAGGDAQSVSLSGTWRCMGHHIGAGAANRTTLWLRIS